MSSTGEGDAPIVEQPAEEPKPAMKEKKPKAPKEKKPKQPKTASHPPYFQMIKEALLALNEKGGSSPYAIAKHMEEKHKAVLPANFRKILALQLKNQTARGKLFKIKASYKLSSEPGNIKKDKDNAGKATRSTTQKNERPKRAVATAAKAKTSKDTEKTKKAGKLAKKVGVQKTKTKTKKSTPAKPKQPKSIKSPSKRARKATASAF